ncbi:unnamed protein product, partial [marine sediment metagenome]
MTQEVMDLSELVQSVKFKFNDQEFEIPPIPDDKLKAIMSTANKITEAGKKGMADDESNDAFIKNQNHFLSLGVQKKEGKNYSKMDIKEFSSWPLKLKNRVMELIFEQIGTSSGEDVPSGSE